MPKILRSFSAIRSVIPYAYSIAQPDVPGSLRSVFIVKSVDGSFVCKFNHRELAVKNAVAGNSLRIRGITAPNIGIYNYNNYWMEVYPMIPGKTLYEYIGDGLSDEQIKHVYKNIVDVFAKMDSIDVSVLRDTQYKYSYQVAKTNISDANNATFGSLFAGAVRLMNNGTAGDIGVYHCGITPKNVLLDDNGNFKALIDLDEVAIADKNYAFAMMAAKYQKMGYNITDLIDYYENQTGRALNHKKIRTITDITNMGKHILWRGAGRIKSR